MADKCTHTYAYLYIQKKTLPLYEFYRTLNLWKLIQIPYAQKHMDGVNPTSLHWTSLLLQHHHHTMYICRLCPQCYDASFFTPRNFFHHYLLYRLIKFMQAFFFLFFFFLQKLRWYILKVYSFIKRRKFLQVLTFIHLESQKSLCLVSYVQYSMYSLF